MCVHYREATTEFMYRLYLRKDSISLKTKQLLDEHREIMNEIDRFNRKCLLSLAPISGGRFQSAICNVLQGVLLSPLLFFTNAFFWKKDIP